MNKTGIIILGIIFGPLIIIGIIKIISKLSGAVKIKLSIPKIGAGSIWKLFLSIISVAIIFLICYEFYLLAIWLWPTPERLAFKKLSRNLAEIELKPEKDTLKSLNEKVKEGKTLTEKEKRAAMMAEEKIRSVRKEYSEGKLAPPLQKAPAKPKEVGQTITIPISEDLKGKAFKSWVKPDGYVGKTSKRNAQYCAKIVEFNEKKLIVLYQTQTDKKNSDIFDGRIDCDHKSNGFYEGKWSDNGKSGFIILSPFYVGNIVDYFKGDEFNVNGSKSIPCWITGRILTF